MTAIMPPLIAILTEIPDPRQKRGKRHPLGAMLALACVATLCGYESVSAIAEWGKHYGISYAAELGFSQHGYPAPATWYRVFRQVDIEAVERRFGAWCQAVLAYLCAEEADRLVISLDGKTLRGSLKQGAAGSHLLSALAARQGVSLGQVAVEKHTNEIGMVEELLLKLCLKGAIVTSDALLTQHKVVKSVLNAEGDYVLPVKMNQEDTYRAIRLWFARPAPPGFPNAVYEETEKRAGRIIRRRLSATTVLNEFLDWQAVQQAFQITRVTLDPHTNQQHIEIAYGITSLPPEQASPADLLRIVRLHWAIENKLHWVRDVTFDEDRSTLRVGKTHQLMAALRNLVISILRLLGYINIAQALRHFAARPRDALALILHSLQK